MSGLFLVLVLTSWTITSCYDIQEVKVTAGENVTLDCDGVSGDISVLDWTRQDITPYSVFYYENNKKKEDNMDPRFRSRVTLKHPKTTSIVLKNVSVSDSGTYKCEVSREGAPAGDDPDRLVKLTVKEIQEAKPGDNVTLECDDVSGDISLLDWTREDITGHSVFFYQNNNMNENNMDPRFRGRVMLKDPKTSHIVLQDVTVSDSGTYECWVKVEGNQRKKRAAVDQRGPPDRVVELIVTDDHHRRHIIPGIMAAGVIANVVVVGVLVFHRKRLSRDRPPGDLLN